MPAGIDSASRHKGEGHRQRLRQKFMTSGLSGFHDYEVIELLLTIATPRKDCKDAAKDALQRFKTLQAVFEASPRALCEVKGIGPKNLFGIKLIKAVAERYLEARLKNKKPLNNSRELFEYLKLRLGHKKRECFSVVYLDAKNRAVHTEILFEGTLTASAVYPREVVRAALNHHAAALILAHNHPSGDPAPSDEDIALTRRLTLACQLMGITVHEHLIIGADTYYSFADQGYMRRIRDEVQKQLSTA